MWSLPGRNVSRMKEYIQFSSGEKGRLAVVLRPLSYLLIVYCWGFCMWLITLRNNNFSLKPLF